MTTQQQWELYLQTLKTDFIKLAKLEFLNYDGSVAFAIDNNYLNKRAGALIQSGSLNVNLQNGQRRSATVTLSNIDGEFDYNINKRWFGERIRLSEGLVLPTGDEYYLPQGVFYVKDPEEAFAPGNRIATYNLVDKWAYLDGTLFGNTEGTYVVPVNSNIFNAIATLLLDDKGNGYVVDNTTPIFTNYYNNMSVTLPSGETVSMILTPYTLRHDGESSTYSAVILELNDMLAGWIGYDQTGALRLDPSQDDILDVNKPIQWAFTPTAAQFLGATYVVKNSEVYNDIIIEGEALDGYPQAAGRATNLDPASDTNVNLIGRKTFRMSSSGYYHNEQCEALAAFKLKRNTVLKKSVTIRSTQMFHLIENNLCTIQRTDKEGGPVERHLITGFSRPLGQTGEMQIYATSVQDFPTATITALPS